MYTLQIAKFMCDVCMCTYACACMHIHCLHCFTSPERHFFDVVIYHSHQKNDILVMRVCMYVFNYIRACELELMYAYGARPCVRVN